MLTVTVTSLFALVFFVKKIPPVLPKGILTLSPLWGAGTGSSGFPRIHLIGLNSQVVFFLFVITAAMRFF